MEAFTYVVMALAVGIAQPNFDLHQNEEVVPLKFLIFQNRTDCERQLLREMPSVKQFIVESPNTANYPEGTQFRLAVASCAEVKVPVGESYTEHQEDPIS